MDPIVSDVLRAYASCQTGMGTFLAPFYALNPPYIVKEGLLHYTRTMNHIKAQDAEKERKEREKKARQQKR